MRQGIQPGILSMMLSIGTSILFSWVVPRVMPFWPLGWGALRRKFRAPHRVTPLQQVLVTLALLLGAVSPALLVFSILALVLCLFDLKFEILPDLATLLLALTGAMIALSGAGPSATDALLGALLGAGILGGLRWGYLRIRGIEALGFGDVKLAAALGLWTGPAAMPWILVGAALLGIAAALISGRDRLAFGPWLIAPAWIFLIVPRWQEFARA